jgi:hypothetical protein
MIHSITPYVSVLAQALPAPNPTLDWLYQFSANLSNLTKQNGGALTQLGMAELSFVSLMVLVGIVINMNVSIMALTLHRQPMHIGDLVYCPRNTIT